MQRVTVEMRVRKSNYWHELGGAFQQLLGLGDEWEGGLIVDEWILIHEEDGKVLPESMLHPDKKYSGKFMLRVDPQLHKALAIHSVQEREKPERLHC